MVRVYEEEQAKKNWKKAVIMPQNEKTINTENTKEIIPSSSVPNLPVGKLLLIKGTNVSFYIPPTGIEVVTDINRNYVRQKLKIVAKKNRKI